MSVRLTPRGWTALAFMVVTVVAGVWTGYPALVGFGWALAAAWIVAVVSVAVPAPVEIDRVVRPERVARLEECTATITVRNTARHWSVAVSGTDRVDGAPVLFDLPRMAGGQSASTTVRIPTQRRGLIEFGPLTIDRRSFADLIRVRRAYGQSASVLVEPRVLDAAGLPAGLRRSHVGAEERIAHGGTDLVGMREYVPGDDLRRLHWATSARRGTLMVREDADPATPYLTVLLDDRAASYEPGGFDEAVDVAASLLDAAAAVPAPARVVTFSADLDLDAPAPISPAGGGALDPRLRAQLATLAPQRSAGALRAYVSSPDVVAVVSGTGADLPDLLLTAASAPVGVVALVDESPASLVSASGGVLVLRGPRAEEVTHGWRVAAAVTG